MFEKAEVHVSLDGKVWVEVGKGSAEVSVGPTIVEVWWSSTEEDDPLDITEKQRARQRDTLYVKFLTEGRSWRTTGKGVLITHVHSNGFIIECGKVTEVAKE